MRNAKLLASIGAVMFSASTAAQTQSPYLQPDDTWISLSGTIESVQRDSFLLDYGRASVTVEMDDGDRDADAYKLLPGDSVTVNGLIDDDFFEMTTIEASSVYVESINSYFYASAMDEEAATFFDPIVTVTGPIMEGDAIIQGTITAVEPLEEELVLNTGDHLMIVEVDDLGYDPLDNEGYLQLDVNDEVTISGTMTEEMFENRLFEADFIVTVNNS
ncbi:hypothetical protein [Pseudohongiella sp.]|uniref:DUF5666 domain-containing protein n=1 Tax=marine sediment metagenome TaxID=412755 RepID=A0A0F9VVC4_9ZZZZ|nr:hypothetical protein [Pseudohongiella sp.]HDZ07979.1 hypothetical protein [Pseudohongiella sp.]HEA64178.1 hypothetical protein [Pseudohongiella sp.]